MSQEKKSYSSQLLRIGALLAVVFSLITVSACTTSTTKTAAKKRSQPKTGRKRLEFKDKQGKLVIEGEGKKLPKDFPTDMPIFKPSKIKSTVSSESEGEAPMAMVIFTTKSKVPAVADFYKGALAEKGWTVNNTVTLGESSVIYTVVKTNQVGSVSVSEDKETKSTIISINIALR